MLRHFVIKKNYELKQHVLAGPATTAKAGCGYGRSIIVQLLHDNVTVILWLTFKITLDRKHSMQISRAKSQETIILHKLVCSITQLSMNDMALYRTIIIVCMNHQCENT